MASNGKGDVTLTPPAAEARAKALPPGGTASDDAPEFIMYMHMGRPVVYQKYMEDVTHVED